MATRREKTAGSGSDARPRGVSEQDLRARLTPSGRPRMALSDRAKIFIPFEPLKGFAEALRAREEQIESSYQDSWDDDSGQSDLGQSDLGQSDLGRLDEGQS